jgi:hypothetical protein
MKNESFKALKHENVENSHELAHQGLRQVAEAKVAAVSWIFPFVLTSSQAQSFIFSSKINE